MSGTRWIRVTSSGNVPPREGRVVALADREIALFNLGDRFLAVENRCPHRGGPLADGIVSGCTVVCPLHAWKISLDTGTVERPDGTTACVRTFPTRVDGDLVLIQLPFDVTTTTPNAQLPTPNSIISPEPGERPPIENPRASSTPQPRTIPFGSWELEVGSWRR